jgi:3-oxoacyl-[acyl-carrier protein] reductase
MNRKKIIITGASRGLGFELVKELHQEYDIIATATSKIGLTKIQEAFPGVIVRILDLGEIDTIEKFVHEFHDSIYALINNAATTCFDYFLDIDFNQARKKIDINFLNTAFLTQMIVKNNLTRIKRIVNISSASTKKIKEGMSLYSSSKASLEVFSKVIAKELANLGILVNSVLPGYMKTDMTSHLKDTSMISLNRFAKTAEISGLVHFLLSEKASYITGQNFVIDGGLTN